MAFGNVLSTVLALIAAGLAGCQTAPADVRLAQLSDHTVSYRVLGSGRPVLVMINGLGDGMSSFSGIAPDLARHATVIVYDRAGYGVSTGPVGPRDAAAAERELLDLLRASGVRGPYVLLGHSLGGTFAEYFAARHPELVAGLILEESRPADFGERCEAAGLSMCTPTPQMMVMSPRGAQAEVRDLGATIAAVRGLPAPGGTLPVMVLSRHPANGAWGVLWARTQADLAARYGVTNRTAPAGGHYIHQDEPAWFLDNVLGFLVAHGTAPTRATQ